MKINLITAAPKAAPEGKKPPPPREPEDDEHDSSQVTALEAIKSKISTFARGIRIDDHDDDADNGQVIMRIDDLKGYKVEIHAFGDNAKEPFNVVIEGDEDHAPSDSAHVYYDDDAGTYIYGMRSVEAVVSFLTKLRKKPKP